MQERTFVLSSVVLSVCGVAFSGYMSAVKFFSTNCVFNEPCPMFLGHPACYFGFGLFVTSFVASTLAATHILRAETMRAAIRVVSAAGVLFAGNFVVEDLARFRAGGYQAGTLVLPTCAYGLIFFLAILAFSFRRIGAGVDHRVVAA